MAKKKQKLDVIDGSKEEHKAFAGKNFSPHHLVSMRPKTRPQEQFMQSFYEGVPIISQVGSSGCGKTYMALYCALSEVLDRSTVYEKVIIVRSAVQSREIGFLSGDSSEKAAAYSLPYISLCDELLTFKSNNFENLQAKGLIQFELTSFLRGLTFDNAIIIVDEVQNMNYSELSTITTRTGVNSKLLLCGDTKQNDLYRKKNDVSGLEDYLRVLDHMPSSSYDCVMYHPEDIVRSGIVKEFLLAEEEVF